MALKALKLTETGDIEFNRRIQPTVLLAVDAVDEIVKAAFSLWLGNWFRDVTRGVDWLNILKKLYDRRTVIQILTTALLKLDFIDEVVDIYISVDNETRVAEFFYILVANGLQVSGSIEV